MDTKSRPGQNKSVNMKEENQNKNQISLTFIVNGTETSVRNVNVNQPVHVAVQKALQQTGNAGRPILEWQVLYNDQPLDLNQKVEVYNLPDNAVIFLSLKAGQGGN